ncbi:multidrug ABC transporter ATP-binding protein [Paenibacillus odorifer]|jgi:ATP-binding cassette subfamily B multidrug efflux pump|uniref:Multidrug ABC transporter ATP-binding protein n=2 Tax=Paenibacillus TaxID=44249 RepID=A0A1R0X7R9_9BACL|nr:ABC transporter-like protein [Paenibacillus sp. FSL H8-237]OMC65708.1 multidrug ABC transporter ATP-binding protein [Paenibacillus odorifer]OMC75574.1 multidrug ABC transporter ATP-binding protein [Paenibacillus odorifer]OMC95681.1 multidrug ABC transporter ATP-binding protein [Paenibacillus odorifer]OMD00939.1 multidrug ABC transporter ATP-binding protein [Paenibacillus odorifer]
MKLEAKPMTATGAKNKAAEQQELDERFVYKDDDVIDKAFDWKQFTRLFGYMKPYAKQMLPLVSIMMILGTITKLTVPFLTSLAIDRAIAPKVGNPSLSLLYSLTAGVIVLYLIQWIAGVYRIKYTNIIGQRVIYDLRSDLFKHIQKLSFNFFDKRPAGSVLVRVTNDINSLQDLFTNGVVNLMIDCVQLMGITIILLVINWKLGLAVMVTVPIMFFVSTKLRQKIRIAWQDVRMKNSRINSHLNESIQGIRVTQAYTQEQENMNYFDVMNTDSKKSWNKASAMNQAFGPIIEVTGGFGTMILFWLGAYLIQSGELTVGMLVAFSSYVSNFWDPINRLGQMYNQLLVAMASSERIFEYLDEQPAVQDNPGAKPMGTIRGDINFEKVIFEYEKGRAALKGIDLDVKAGQSIALVGHTGSGKSTIINLIGRFYDIKSGRITIDGEDIRGVTLDSLRRQIGIVLQDTFIFSGTIRDNIRFGRLEATDEEVENAAKAVDAHDFIMKLPGGYETEVEERGSALSMGQRQLLSFARALLANPRILILDEATASIDTETELKIQEALKILLQGRTSFIVAHRLSTIRHADKIVVLDHGEIKEEGNHHELTSRDGVYNGLIEAQFRFL